MPAAKKAATKAATTKVVVKDPFANNAEAILKKLGLYYDIDEGKFIEDEDEPRRPEPFRFFAAGDDYEEWEGVASLPHTCAVLVFGDFDVPDVDLTSDELGELFKHAVAQELRRANRKQAIATTTQSQKQAAAWLEGAGFKPVGTSKNPGSGNDVTIWVLSI